MRDLSCTVNKCFKPTKRLRCLSRLERQSTQKQQLWDWITNLLTIDRIVRCFNIVANKNKKNEMSVWGDEFLQANSEHKQQRMPDCQTVCKTLCTKLLESESKYWLHWANMQTKPKHQECWPTIMLTVPIVAAMTEWKDQLKLRTINPLVEDTRGMKKLSLILPHPVSVKSLI